MSKKEDTSVYTIEGIKQVTVLDGNDRKINKIVADIEKDIRMNRDYETGVIVDREGNVIVDKRGKSFSVGFSDEECTQMKDAIFTHNHPRGWKTPENNIRRIGSSFSMEDLSLAIGNDVAEIRAVTPNYTFVMRRPEKGWGVSWEDFQATYRKENAKLKKEFVRRIEKGILTVSQAETTHYHILARRIAKKYDWEYIKGKTR